MDTFLIEFQKIAFAGMKPGEFAAYVFYSYAGIIVSMLIEVYRHNKLNKNFNFGTLFMTNCARILASIITIPFVISSTDLYLNIPLTTGSAFFIGFSIDKVIESLLAKKGESLNENNNKN